MAREYKTKGNKKYLKCNKCGKFKLFTEKYFRVQSASQGGLTPTCLICTRRIERERERIRKENRKRFSPDATGCEQKFIDGLGTFCEGARQSDERRDKLLRGYIKGLAGRDYSKTAFDIAAVREYAEAALREEMAA